jgi:hypothetical protein
VGIRGEPQWLKLEGTETATGPLRAGEAWHSGFDPRSRSVRTSWISGSDLAREVDRSPFLRIERARDSTEGLRVYLDAGNQLGGEKEGTVALHLARSALPPEALTDLHALDRMLPRTDFEDFLGSAAKGDYSRAADVLLKSPDAIEKGVTAFRQTKLSQAHDALAKADYDSVIRNLTPLAELTPSDPDVLLPLTLARLRAGVEANVARDLPSVAKTTAPRYFQAVNTALAEAAPADRVALRRIAEYGDLQLLAEKRGGAIQAFPMVARGQFDFGAELAEVVRMSRASAERSGVPGVPRYTALAAPSWSADWTAPIVPAVDQLPPGQFAVWRIDDPALARLHPGLIVNPADGAVYVLDHGSDSAQAGDTYVPYSQGAGGSPKYIEIYRPSRGNPRDQ